MARSGGFGVHDDGAPSTGAVAGGELALAEVLQARCDNSDAQGVLPTWAPQPLLGLVS
ncbi:MAG: hypothetical protein GY745_08330 [Actinomycetia bacterium]|nr:hypothetical protein [Actinomycetes bacterium]MCP3910885.1 hypothetical protein [Actinomycetes bacterium]MCP4085041.1 hypothetical protein [Actinomycetes bacterium]